MSLLNRLHEAREPVFGTRLRVMLLLLMQGAAMGLTPETSMFKVAEDGTWLQITAPMAAEPGFQVVPQGSPEAALFGTVSREGSTMTFHPAVPLLEGQAYELSWRSPEGREMKWVRHFKRQAMSAAAPTVRMSPQGTLPANALKFYLHFSQPMEQGIFLDRLKLLDETGKEVIGPFRETELWSPDGRRLTVWFHPGRQKTGVNLNEEEGPVLQAGQKHTLVIAGSWRSTGGVALGEDVRLDFQAGAVDHTMPKMDRWQITAPKAGSQEPLRLDFEEGLDPAMLLSALKLLSAGRELPLETPEISAEGRRWSVRPRRPWPAGDVELHANPNLEDLAGNSLLKPFEVDASQPPSAPDDEVGQRFQRRFTLR